MRRTLADRYGPRGLVVGGSEGLGAAWARALAVGGLDLVLVARRPDPLEATAAAVRAAAGVTVTTLPGDLRRPEEWLAGVGSADVVVLNAALAPTGPFCAADPDQLQAAVEVNCLGALRVARALLPAMVARRRGALVVMSSMAGRQGFPGLATYAATKAFLAVWAESLWAELRGDGVDVLACVAGAVSTPGYAAQMAASAAPGTLPAERVVGVALASLGRKPVVVPGRINALAVLLGRLAPRQVTIEVMAAVGRGLGSAAAADRADAP